MTPGESDYSADQAEALRQQLVDVIGKWMTGHLDRSRATAIGFALHIPLCALAVCAGRLIAHAGDCDETAALEHKLRFDNLLRISMRDAIARENESDLRERRERAAKGRVLMDKYRNMER